MTSTTPHPSQPTSVPVLRRILVYGAFLAVGIMVIGAIVGGLVAGASGVVSALIGTVMAVVFMGITAGSILLANRFAGSEAAIGAFFGIVMGGWLVKFVVFLALMFLLRGQPWIQPVVLLLSIIAGVIGSLVVDVVVVMKSRMPYASDVTLPKAPSDD
ncbi:hypothetical protein E3T54_15665 [Cryobacterium sp. Sr8]|uniref:ATP synthase protein I n=1 Tax=Cryobacterium psychrotolerans TaxID=386301 RepID=A0A1G8YWU1_9MICO|nr:MULTISPECIES: hypothetical protein [Cryobacterium]TFD43257.1 hypothetical protein E3T33_10525 [Cryobacterium sp. TMT1-2-1]TFD74216.1 hypothetical protein E3T54_15665 [Cryobacterium sp. Sr8]TFD85683.1 hypothetical protein E3T56_08115 [Cryobacterium psychrotolerans]SDK07251.1 hypothetical protein SAMN05216282_102318 [Cryobacterium psychrotolerans]